MEAKPEKGWFKVFLEKEKDISDSVLTKVVNIFRNAV